MIDTLMCLEMKQVFPNSSILSFDIAQFLSFDNKQLKDSPLKSLIKCYAKGAFGCAIVTVTECKAPSR